jgi:hypothetical protein
MGHRASDKRNEVCSSESKWTSSKVYLRTCSQSTQNVIIIS